MGVILRPYQQDVETGIFEAWQKPRADNTVGTRNVLAVAPTGAGKTAIMSSVTKKITSPSASIAHRQELVSQISLALARNEIYHDIIAAEPVIRFCIGRHIEELGKNFHHAKAPVATAGVQTIIRRGDSLKQWCSSVGMWNIDEAHHVTPDNSWGKAVNMFPNAFGLGFTASPLRADRKPLGRALGGIFDHMVLGPTMRELIRMGYLSEYRLIAPTLSIDRAQIPISEATGELNQTELRKAAHKSTVTGDIVENYLKFASGMRGIAFVVDIEQAKETAERFNAAGVKAMAVSSKTPDLIRQDAIRRFSRGDLTVLVNVDLFGEGFDVPAVEVVMMGRPTESFGLYLQQFGRALRLFDGKLFGIIIDHVGNYARHGLPDAKRTWSLEQDLRGTPRGQRDPDVLPMRRCTQCFSGYEAITMKCPFCGYVEEPESRAGPEFVDGDLTELSPEFLARLRGEVEAIEHGSAGIPYGVTDPAIIGAINKNFRNRQALQTELRDAINLWAGIETTINGRTDSQAYSVFYHKFGVDVLTAQKMPAKDMSKLLEKIREGFY
jgi:DNA repair protein RadD